MDSSLLNNYIDRVYNYLQQDPLVINFSKISFGEHFESLNDFYIYIKENSERYPIGVFIFCLGCIPGLDLLEKSLAELNEKIRFCQRIVLITDEDLKRCIETHPLLLHGEYFLSKPSIIGNNLFIGKAGHCNHFYLGDFFDTIINVTRYTKLNDNYCKNYYHFPMDDEEYFPISPTTEKIFEILCAKTKEGRCLIFCDKGCSRSAVIAAYFIGKRSGFDMKTTVSKIKEIYPKFSPNQGFLNQLDWCLR